jgi:hypothetical protein
MNWSFQKTKGALRPFKALLILVSYTIKNEEMSMDIGLKGMEVIVTGGTRSSSVLRRSSHAQKTSLGGVGRQ